MSTSGVEYLGPVATGRSIPVYRENLAAATTLQKTVLLEADSCLISLWVSSAWAECPAGQTTDIDITPSATEDRWVSGGFVVHKDSNPGDVVAFKVVHPVAGVVETYVPSWLVTPGTGSELIEVYPARIPAGLILRVSYTNVGATAAYCGINYLLHRRGTGA